ncbi:MAG TPA: pitrilysin family protein [Usitatibacter sp.]|nr:pitrilysin family protein [Usitatibacter sp.]
MKLRHAAAALFLAALSIAASAADVALPKGVTRGPTVEGITEYDLANGLKVLFAPDASKPTTTVNTTYLVGSRMEHYGETGMAHLLEHLMFKGTPKYPQVWKDFTRLGLRANGSTWVDRTNYFASFAANDATLDWYLRWSADAMTHSFIARKDLDSEMTVVRNELELGENNPFRVLWQRSMSAAYNWHAYGKSTIGARADVENVNIDHLQAFYRKFYQPDNAVLIIAGRFDEAKTLALIANVFGAIPRPKRALEPLYTIDAAQDGERSVVVRRVGDTQLVMDTYHVPAAADPDFAAVELLGTIMGDPDTGRLHRTLVETHEAASGQPLVFNFHDPGVVIFVAQLPGDASIDKARATMISTVEGAVREPITAAELDRARTKYLKDFELAASDPEQVGVALSETIAQGDWRLFFLDRDRVRNAKVEDVQRVATRYFIQDNRTIGLFIPTQKPDRAPTPAFVDVAPMVKGYKGDPAVAAGEAFAATPANIESRTKRFTLANGMKVAVVPIRTRGAIVDADIVLRLGDEKSLLGTQTVASLVGSMLDRGAAGMTRQQIHDAFDKLKASVTFAAEGPVVDMKIETTRENLPEALKLAAKVLREPTFPAPELDQLRNEVMTAAESQRKEPRSLARLALRRHGNPYPKEDVRYVADYEEQIARAKAVTLEQVKDFHAKFYGADHGDVAIVGDVDAAAMPALLGSLFGDWKSASPYTRVPRPYYDVKPESIRIETPDKANAYYTAGLQFQMQDTDPDYAALLVANRILGGGPGSQLWQRVREKEGLSYGIGSGISVSPYETRGSFTTGAIYAPQNLPKLETAYKEEMAHAATQGFTEAQMRDAKSGLLQERTLERAQNAQLADTLTDRLDVDRTLAYDKKVDDAIAAVTLDQVNAAFRKYVDPSKLTSVRAGDFNKK